MESTEFVSQLANFSAVEQQVRTNDRLDKIFAALSGGASAGLADWIGREGPRAGAGELHGRADPGETTPLDGADTALLVVKDDFGKVVAQRAVDAKAERLSWDGKDPARERAAQWALLLHGRELQGRGASGDRPRPGLLEGHGGPDRGRGGRARAQGRRQGEGEDVSAVR
jgi:hypothetical protein